MEKQFLKLYLFEYQIKDFEKALKSAGVKRFTIDNEKCAKGYYEVRIFASAWEMYQVGKNFALIELNNLQKEN